MKVAVTTSGDDWNAPMDQRFGRAACFLIYDLDKDSYELVDNKQNLTAAQGAGIQAAQTVARQNVGAVITGNCGPKAFRTLAAAGITIYTTDAATVREAVDAFKEGVLVAADGANVEGHWGGV